MASLPFVPFPARGWPATVERLQRLGEPWTADEVIMDLRWHVDQRVPLPGRPELQKRWQWTEWNTRQMLAQPDLWWDPTKGEAPKSRAELLQRTSSRPPARLQPTSSPDTDEPAQSARILQRASSRPPADLQRTSTRAVSTTPSPSPSPETRPPKGSGVPAGWEEAVEVYQTVYRPAIGKRVHPPLKPGQGNGKHLSTLLKRHGLEDTTKLLRHCATSPKRSFLRERGYDLQTVVRHSQEYLDDALQETPSLRLASPSRPPDPGPRPPPPEELATLEELDALMAVVAGGRRAS